MSKEKQSAAPLKIAIQALTVYLIYAVTHLIYYGRISGFSSSVWVEMLIITATAALPFIFLVYALAQGRKYPSKRRYVLAVIVLMELILTFSDFIPADLRPFSAIKANNPFSEMSSFYVILIIALSVYLISLPFASRLFLQIMAGANLLLTCFAFGFTVMYALNFEYGFWYNEIIRCAAWMIYQTAVLYFVCFFPQNGPHSFTKLLNVIFLDDWDEEKKNVPPSPLFDDFDAFETTIPLSYPAFADGTPFPSPDMHGPFYDVEQDGFLKRDAKGSTLLIPGMMFVTSVHAAVSSALKNQEAACEIPSEDIPRLFEGSNSKLVFNFEYSENRIGVRGSYSFEISPDDVQFYAPIAQLINLNNTDIIRSTLQAAIEQSDSNPASKVFSVTLNPIDFPIEEDAVEEAVGFAQELYKINLESSEENNND